jgi:hypothetical protein
MLYLPPLLPARCAGIVSPADHDRLVALLKGMCIRRNIFDENEYGMSAPLQVRTLQQQQQQQWQRRQRRQRQLQH